MAYSSENCMVDAKTAMMIREREKRRREQLKSVLITCQKTYEVYKKKALYEIALDYVSK